jgi:hypothetical protein
MVKMFIVKILCILIVMSSLLTSVSAYSKEYKQSIFTNNYLDFDPLVNIELTVDIIKIRSLEKFDYPNPKIKKIDLIGDPDFFVKVFINGNEFISNVWYNIKYIYNPQFSPIFDVPDEEENVSIKIQLWDWNTYRDKHCDISGDNPGLDVELTYSIKNGHWTGDDKLGVNDPSGYGRLNGCDDGSIFTHQKDCELWFNIYQTDPDGDGIPYWIEVNDYGTDPTVNNKGEDTDGDGIPIEWEWKWGYDPFKKDSHSVLDPDQDGLNNYEEYLVSAWDSDPFRQDIFMELDHMEESPNGIKSILPEGSKELLYTAFNRYNKVFHIDDGQMGGGEIIPFDELISDDQLEQVYWRYFLHNNQNNWRKGVFHYSLIIYYAGAAGYVFQRGAFVVSSTVMEQKTIPKTQKTKDRVYASGYMHETGHTFDLYNPGVDNRNTYFPWQQDFWVWGHYKSAMNYRYVFRLVDYSDGSRKINDFNDWEDMDLIAFQKPW